MTTSAVVVGHVPDTGGNGEVLTEPVLQPMDDLDLTRDGVRHQRRCNERGPTLRIRSADRLFDTPVDSVFGSDHFGVTAELELP